MRGLKFTSPGALLIVSISLAGAILMLDSFFLGPYVRGQKDAALREQAAKAEQYVRDAIAARQDKLRAITVACAQNPILTGLLTPPCDPNVFGCLARNAFAQADISLAWMTDASGKVTATWSRSADAGGAMEIPAWPEQPHSAPVADDSKATAAGLMRLGTVPVVFGRCQVTSPDNRASGWLWAARPLDASTLARIGQSLGGQVMLAPGESLPPCTPEDTATSHAIWPVSDDELAVAWPAFDAAGNVMGYLRADIPVSHIYAQSVAARRIALIVLTLSLGLVVLVITGTHILVAGPVVRLLKRLQQLDSGQTSLGSLTRDLHGEPLVLARRIESAFERLAHMSKTDQLTGLANRRHFQEVLECFYHQSRRYNRPLSLMAIDVDFFKAINDTCGHQHGDKVLQLVARAVESVCRKADLPARLGGDEFSILLPETSCDDAERVARRILESVAGKPIEARGLTLRLTLSIGLTDLNAGEIDGPEAMVALADRALYAAKELGRNRVVLAHDLTGVALRSDSPERSKVELLCHKVAGLDTRFQDMFLQSVEELVEMLEKRDPNMADHARKVQHFAVLIAREMGLPDRIIKRIQIAAMLHDIGMLAMPDSLLLCPGPLSPEQVQNMRSHPLLSVRIMEGLEFLEQEIPAVRYHHERYDGQGYPEGLAGAAIPLSARILSVADTFDALLSPRAHRQPLSLGQALDEMKRAAGTQLDPVVVEALLAVAGRVGDALTTLPPATRVSLWRETGPEQTAVRGLAIAARVGA